MSLVLEDLKPNKMALNSELIPSLICASVGKCDLENAT